MIFFQDKARIREMIRSLEEIAGGNLDRRVPSFPSGPLGRLSVSLHSLLRVMRERITRLEKENRQMETMLNSMIEGVIAVDKQTRIILVNPTVTSLFHIDDETVEGKLFLEVFRNTDIAELISSVLSGGKYRSDEITLTWPLQKVFQVSASPLFQEKTVSGCLLVIHDVTDIRKLERMRSDFVANVSHELKTPLTSIKGFVETLLEGALDDKENSIAFLRIIQNHTERLNHLINDLLSLSRVESKSIELEVVDIPLKEMLNSVLAGFRAKIRKKSIAVEVTVSETRVIRADRDNLEQVLINLIDNAIKFNREKGTLIISCTPLDTQVKIAVEDTGSGIPAKDLPRIFERFYRVDKARSRALGGTGLGLSIVKHIIDLHGGTVGVESTEGIGTQVWFTLPIEEKNHG
ncbi:MAG: cell wall metabolism sensor histidine kinase WalK [Candidatus Omnitrophica bacterium]|nr:cell wall metabolism sensor histidine kinase WalK [Candidatus Omnitrophota bacterium]